MTRPPRAKAATIRSIAFAIWGRARRTAGATFASSELIMRAISRADRVSSSAAARLRRSVASAAKSFGVGFFICPGNLSAPSFEDERLSGKYLAQCRLDARQALGNPLHVLAIFGEIGRVLDHLQFIAHSMVHLSDNLQLLCHNAIVALFISPNQSTAEGTQTNGVQDHVTVVVGR